MSLRLRLDGPEDGRRHLPERRREKIAVLGELVEIADLVTEMREVKHPYTKGILAQRGIDY
jgi:hypothetical protein